jgi:hypothetical protein
MTTAGVPNHNLARIYTIKRREDLARFVPGRTGDGEQVLMGVLAKELLVSFFFSPDGQYLRYEFFPVPYDPELPPGQHGNVLEDAKRRWMTGLGMIASDIQVRHFAFPEWRIGIAEWPQAWFPEVQRALSEGKPFEDEFLEEWQQEGRWVLFWHNDYWMTADGEICAT